MSTPTKRRTPAAKLTEIAPAPPGAAKVLSITQEEVDLFHALQEPRCQLIAWDFHGQDGQSFEISIDEYNALKRELSRLRGYKSASKIRGNAA